MKHCRRKYSLGGAWSFVVSPLFAISQYSSSRQRSHGSQLQLPSRKATRRRGQRSRTAGRCVELRRLAALPHLQVLAEPPEEPRQPAAVAFQEGDPQAREALEDAA